MINSKTQALEEDERSQRHTQQRMETATAILHHILK